ncbi:hypothetical protein M9978_08340 [Sphingomonas sp. MG17]|uniref:Uncharacterized protein n=1 Tax=Sphingomonas tagetis TaxID=2949092 RepID=A0A9X2KLI5_9SPHN|nr:hypothetical protein [Sphingomonas tagetis]MCP3730436.1 hypothetical protein [Sphingomonas tagetis]
MADGYGNNRTGASDGTLPVPVKIPGAVNGGRVASFYEKFDLSKANVQKVATNRNLVGEVPVGHRLLSIKVRSSVSLTTSQLKFGDGSDDDKFGVAAAYGTTAEVEKEYLLVAQQGEPLTADTKIWMTHTTADLPGAGLVTVEVRTSARG